ncbi:hypothetical protein FB45DRAFT_918511 [Roridomyces roridus]|uniref:Uncharacterized protein n=1 Tax=Roridomyces roridus TaxID=1738132 RepID=A0AAD7BR75_9AGAR|nr:hypothetical protein FB45DRAFT_918511 [Roridomyces roridus]
MRNEPETSEEMCGELGQQDPTQGPGTRFLLSPSFVSPPPATFAMFSLLRRFSGSTIPRADRPWEEDPTSNAPQVGRKRRMADEDRDEDEDEQARLKKSRGGPSDAERGSSATPLPQAKETEGVKEVTQGVKEVDLEEKPTVLPESVPLPDETSPGELDADADADASSTASTPPPQAEAQHFASETVVVPPPVTAEGQVLDPAVADNEETKDLEPAAEDTTDTAPETTDTSELVDAPTTET